MGSPILYYNFSVPTLFLALFFALITAEGEFLPYRGESSRRTVLGTVTPAFSCMTLPSLPFILYHFEIDRGPLFGHSESVHKKLMRCH